MANKRFLLMMLIMAFLSFSGINVSAKNPTNINLEAGYIDPEGNIDDKQRSPIPIPYVGIDDYGLTFYTPCGGDTLQLLDDNDNVVFETMIPFGTTTLVLPSYLSGEYQIHIIRDRIYFYGIIEF